MTPLRKLIIIGYYYLEVCACASQESDPMEKSEQMFFDSIKWRKDIEMYETLWENGVEIKERKIQNYQMQQLHEHDW